MDDPREGYAKVQAKIRKLRQAGQKVPDDLVLGVLGFLTDRGFPQAEEFTAATETLTFSLPKELRKDLRPATAG